MNPNGRPRVLDNVANQEQVLHAVADGLSERAAAQSVGIGIRTLQRFTRERPKFRARLRKAKARHEAQLVASINDAISTNPRIAAWKLERHNPKDYHFRRPPPFNLDQALDIVSALFKAAFQFIVGDRSRQGYSEAAHRLLEAHPRAVADRLKQGLQPPFWLSRPLPSTNPNAPPAPPLPEQTNPSAAQTDPHPTTMPPLTPTSVETSDPPSSDPPGSDPPASEAPTSDPLTSDAPSSDVSSSVQ